MRALSFGADSGSAPAGECRRLVGVATQSSKIVPHQSAVEAHVTLPVAERLIVTQQHETMVPPLTTSTLRES